MKKILTISFSILAIAAFAQVPQGLNYQAVARDVLSGTPKQNTNINVKFTILQGSINGTPVYTEMHSDTTNEFGLFTLTIGHGVSSDTFSNIDWTSGMKFLKVEIDNQLTGTTQLWSVPYAFSARFAKSTDDWKNSGDTLLFSQGKRVGINTTNPKADLDVNGSIWSTAVWPSLRFNNQAGKSMYWEMPPSGKLYLFDPQLQKYRISFDENGNCGIGTTLPQANLDVNGSVIIGSPDMNDPSSPLSKINIGGDIIAGRFEAEDVGIIIKATNNGPGAGTTGINISSGGGSSDHVGIIISASNGSTNSDNIGVSARASGDAKNVYGGYFVGAGSTFGGSAENAIGIYAQASGASGTNKAGIFQGNVQVIGNLSKSGGSFLIDHPSDPENKYLSHSFVESPDMLNIYNGNTTTNEIGIAIVELPDYFESENIDFRYQLTCIGKFSNVIILKEIEANQFTIQTSEPHTKVSWQVTGVRNDEWAKNNRIIPEIEKNNREKGYYLHPEYFGQPESKGIKSLYYHKESQVNKKE